MSEPTIRQEVRKWVDAVLDAGDDVDPKIEAQRGVNEFSQNPAITERWFRETAYDLFFQVFMNRLSQRRSAVADASRVVTKLDVKNRLEADAPDFGRWMERDPETGRQRSLLGMVKEQVLAAADARRQHNQTGLRREAFLRFIAGRLKPGQRVGEVWDDDLLSDLMARIDVKTKFLLKGANAAPKEEREAAD